MYFGISKLSASIALNDSSDSSPQVNPPHGDFSLTFPQTSPQAFPQTFPQTFPQPTETSNNSILSGKRGCFTDKRYLTSNYNQERQSYRLRWLGADLPPSVLEGGAREAGGPGPPRVIPRRDVVNQPQLHPVGSFAERHPANSPLGDFSQQIPKATKTPATRFCPEKGGVLRTK